ncbi:hypothetical protein BKH43_05320 [Helicobacter sp. 13S00401-1]|uniref:TM2 domain-containing protein n=1 Tax=Helicobacter sp. 13S00401-1 TaxID=1905758 RepID=UPI000BD53895|nr:TM2 domain-containing protein [Helicobacter sp. 13S00401-1]PAF50164.1 hypothetical protein BKH43_05320 [Helicobacter sp. 13S00401-1]
MGQQAMTLLATWNDRIPADSYVLLTERLKKMQDDKMSALLSLNLKSPIVGLVLGLFFGLFGVDRFYKGDIVLGVVKLFIGWLTLGIWPIVDLFLVYKGIKKDNLEKISNVLLLTS